LSKLRAGVITVQFLLVNVLLGIRLPRFRTVKFEGLSFQPCTRARVNDVVKLFTELSMDRSMGIDKRLLLRLLGTRISLVCVDMKSGEVVGMMIFYFRLDESHKHIIHQAFTGLRSSYRGKGLGTTMRRVALNHFASVNWLAGVSSRVSINNKPSLMSNLKLGFMETHRYHDKQMGVERVYLVCDLTPYRVTSEPDC
jgi:RimJ/RimL family protein N-acetyltransferase